MTDRSSLTYRLLNRVGRSFGQQLQSRHSGERPTTAAAKRAREEELIAHFGKMLDTARMRYRKLQRFARYVSSACVAETIDVWLSALTILRNTLLQRTMLKHSSTSFKRLTTFSSLHRSLSNRAPMSLRRVYCGTTQTRSVACSRARSRQTM